jgi:poly(3-hydroxybutyrate) depolymerase
MTKLRDALPLLLLALLVMVTGPASSEVRNETIMVEGARRTFHLFVPPGISAESPAPLLLLLHGSYQSGRALLGYWTELAARERLLLVAPDSVDQVGWQIRRDGPELIRAVIAQVSDQQPVDDRRIYLFGLSGGAVYSLTLAMLESDYFAATAVFAGAWREPSFFELLPHARRRIPVAMFVGTRDRFFPLQDVMKTARALEAAGHPVLLELLDGRGHAYAPVAREVNERAWEFLRPVALGEAPAGVPAAVPGSGR